MDNCDIKMIYLIFYLARLCISNSNKDYHREIINHIKKIDPAVFEPAPRDIPCQRFAKK